MPLIQWERRIKALRDPALVCAFGGWQDAAHASIDAGERILDMLDAERVARIDDERFFNFADTRPDTRLLETRERVIAWPEVVLYLAEAPAPRRDVLVLVGPEPSMCWRTFAAMMVELAHAYGIQLIVALGALLADVPHTRPSMVTGMMSDDDLAELVGIVPAPYKGPTGLTGVMHAEFANSGIPAATIWAAVPHYVASMGDPCAIRSLLYKTSRALGIPFDLEEISAEAIEFRDRLDAALEVNPQFRELVTSFEHKVDSPNAFSLGMDEIPDAEALAEDFQRYLLRREQTQHGDDDGDDENRGADGPDD